MVASYVLVCQNADCKSRGAGELLEKLAGRLKDSGDVEVKPYMCFGACQAGPNLVLYPQKVWYCGVKPNDVDEIAAHAAGGPGVERLTHGVDASLKELIYQLLDAGLF
ncbi:MAG: 2Fe-2S ferredoxin [Acidobacteria bacterium]|nr:MAG: 2Fe-2S ferredoxin [Acidobacteriota bacterium]